MLMLCLASVVFITCTHRPRSENSINRIISSIDTFPVPSSVRALQVVDERTIWFAGSNGVYGYTENGGRSWQIDSIPGDSIAPHFRSVAVTADAVFMLCIGSPAIVYKSGDKGNTWRTVYRENHPDAFYNSMKFWNDQEGIAMGDPTDGCLSILITNDGGETWRKLPCSQLPATAEGEAAFAASNSNIALSGSHAWVVTGGAKARIFHTPDKGQTWAVYETPIAQGGKMTGIFSTDFYDENNGIIFGGNWEAQQENARNKAITQDGGRTWKLVADGSEPGYRSCVKYIPGGNGRELIAVGTPGISYSGNGGQSWKELSAESFYAIDFSKDGKIAWVAGNNKIGKITWSSN